MVVFALDSVVSFQNARGWLKDAVANTDEHVEMVLVAHDTSGERLVSAEDGQALADEFNAGYFEVRTTGDRDERLDEAFLSVIEPAVAKAGSLRTTWMNLGVPEPPAVSLAGAKPVVVPLAQLVTGAFESVAALASVAKATDYNLRGLTLEGLARDRPPQAVYVSASGLQLSEADVQYLAGLPVDGLDLSGCGLTSEAVEPLSTCVSLRRLSLARNQLANVPYGLYPLEALEYLDLTANPCFNNAHAVLKQSLQSPQAVAELVRSGAELSRWNVVTVVPFGNGRAGKSTTIASLTVGRELSWYNRDVVAEDMASTPRIVFSEPLVDETSGIEFVFMDVPGQTQATSFNSMCHGVLVQSVALVVVRLHPVDAERVATEMRMWLNAARSTYLQQKQGQSFASEHGGERMSVILVATHADLASSKVYEPLLAELHAELESEFGEVLDLGESIYAVDARSGKKIQRDVQRRLRELSARIIAQRPVLPAWLVEARRVFAERFAGQRVLTRTAVAQFFEAELKRPAAGAAALLDVLSSCGSVIAPAHAEFVLADPHWFSALLFALVPEPHQQTDLVSDKYREMGLPPPPQPGIVRHDVLLAVLVDRVEDVNVENVLVMLEVLDVARVLTRDENGARLTWFIPARLQTEQIDRPVSYTWPESEWVEQVLQGGTLVDRLTPVGTSELVCLPLRLSVQGSTVPLQMMLSRVIFNVVGRLGEKARRFTVSRSSFACVFTVGDYAFGHGLEADVFCSVDDAQQAGGQDAQAAHESAWYGSVYYVPQVSLTPEERMQVFMEPPSDEASAKKMAIWASVSEATSVHEPHCIDVMLLAPRGLQHLVLRNFVYDAVGGALLVSSDKHMQDELRVSVRRLCCGCVATQECVIDEHTHVSEPVLAGQSPWLDMEWRSVELLLDTLSELNHEHWRAEGCEHLGAHDLEMASSLCVFDQSEVELDQNDAAGAGNFGEVLRGRVNGESVVMKRMKSVAALEGATAMKREAAMMCSIGEHECVASVLGVAELPVELVPAQVAPWADYGDYAYGNSAEPAAGDKPPATVMHLVMQDAGYGNLAQELLHDNSKWCDAESFPIVLSLLIDVSAGMAHMHAQGIIHNDIACRNVVVRTGEDGRLRASLTDLGLAQRLPDGITLCRKPHDQLPWRQLAPEVVGIRCFSRATDVYQFGTLLVEVLTRQAMWTSERQRGMPLSHIARTLLLQAKTSTDDVPLSLCPDRDDVVAFCPDALWELAAECLSALARHRPSAREVHARLCGMAE